MGMGPGRVGTMVKQNNNSSSPTPQATKDRVLKSFMIGRESSIDCFVNSNCLCGQDD